MGSGTRIRDSARMGYSPASASLAIYGKVSANTMESDDCRCNYRHLTVYAEISREHALKPGRVAAAENHA